MDDHDHYWFDLFLFSAIIDRMDEKDNAEIERLAQENPDDKQIQELYRRIKSRHIFAFATTAFLFLGLVAFIIYVLCHF